MGNHIYMTLFFGSIIIFKAYNKNNLKHQYCFVELDFLMLGKCLQNMSSIECIIIEYRKDSSEQNLLKDIFVCIMS